MPEYRTSSSRASDTSKERKLAQILAEKKDKTTLQLSRLGAGEAVRVVDVGTPLKMCYVGKFKDSSLGEMVLYSHSDSPPRD